MDGQRLRDAAIQREMTRDDLGRRTGCSKNTVVNAHAERPVSLSRAVAIAKALRVPLRDLIVAEPETATQPKSAAKPTAHAFTPLTNSKQEGAKDGD